MNKIYNFIKKNSSWLIPALGILCLICYCAAFILSLVQGVDNTTDVFDVLRIFLSGIFVYLVGVFMMIFGRARNNARMQKLIVFLSGIYLAVSNFVSGVNGMFMIVNSGATLIISYVLSFIVSLAWVFILCEGSYGYLQNNFERRIGVIANLFSVVLILNLVSVVLSFIIAGANGALISIFIASLPSLTSLFYLACLYCSYIDIYYIGYNNPRPKKDKEKKEKIDLDIHSY